METDDGSLAGRDVQLVFDLILSERESKKGSANA
jgi:hypothetical protein